MGGRGTAAIGHERWRKEREEGGRKGERKREGEKKREERGRLGEGEREGGEQLQLVIDMLLLSV